jgi:hypothetical protein
MDSGFPVPVSRHTAVSEQALVAAGLATVVRSAQTGACIVEDPENRAVCIFDHLEYDEDTLHLEYERDRQSGKAIKPPNIAQPGSPWRPYAALFFRNWLDTTCTEQVDPDPALAWLFQRRSQDHPLGAKLLLQASSRPHLLAEVLRYLDCAGASVRSARIRRHGAPTTVVVMELEDRLPATAVRAAASLLDLPGTRRVLYRLIDGSGGVLRPGPVRLTWAA